jgi:hypothetical protein
MKHFYFFLSSLLFCATVSFAQFSGSYAPANWTTTKSPASNGNINGAGARASIIITGSDGASATNVNTDFTIPVVASGLWSFSWSYHSNDSYSDPKYDVVGVLINGVFTQLSSNTGSINQSGTYNGTSVTAGTVIGFRVMATDNLYGNATFTISNFSRPNGILPVKLSSFTAQKEAGGVRLQWNTETEYNSDRFEVQRSANGRDFATIATVAAQGIAARNIPYTAFDGSPFIGTTFYRLHMVDKDGTAVYSKTITVNTKVATALKLFPNPAAARLEVIIVAAEGGSEALNIYNMEGKLVKSNVVQLVAGTNKIAVPLDNLLHGVYFIRSVKYNLSEQFIKQ